MLSHQLQRIQLGALASLAAVLVLAACGGGGGSTMPPPKPSPSPSPSSSPQCTAYIQKSIPGFIVRIPLRETKASAMVPGVVGVRFASGDMTRLSTAISMVHGISNTPLNEQHAASIGLPKGADPMAMAAKLRAMPGVISAGPVIERYTESTEVIPNDPYFGTVPYDVTNPTTSNPALQWDMYTIDMPQAWALATGFGSSSVKVAIIDTGYDMTNTDLEPGASRVAASIVYDLGNGLPDNSATAQDHDGHGTDVSGIAAADTNNAHDVAGMAGGITLLEARVFANPSSADPCPGASTEDVAAAINWAVTNGAKVINMSLGSSTPDDTFEEPAVASAISHGVTVVAAAGNSGDSSLDYPANDPGVLAAGASAYNDAASPRVYPASGTNGDFEYVASYSNYVLSPASSKYYVVAPGGDPDSAQGSCSSSSCVDFLQWITNLYSNTAFSGQGELVLIAGTSMASPHIAGIAALMLSKDPTLTPTQIGQTISTTTDNINDSKQGHGRVNALGALNATL
jgi:subtilisin family serine protease